MLSTAIALLAVEDKPLVVNEAFMVGVAWGMLTVTRCLVNGAPEAKVLVLIRVALVTDDKLLDQTLRPSMLKAAEESTPVQVPIVKRSKASDSELWAGMSVTEKA